MLIILTMLSPHTFFIKTTKRWQGGFEIFNKSYFAWIKAFYLEF